MENMARVERKFKLDLIEVNSIQLEPSGPRRRPNDTKLHPRGLSWEYLLQLKPTRAKFSAWLELGTSLGSELI